MRVIELISGGSVIVIDHLVKHGILRELVYFVIKQNAKGNGRRL